MTDREKVVTELVHEWCGTMTTIQALERAYNAGRAAGIEEGAKLVENDGHSHSCQFRGCTCGSIDAYKAARMEFLRIVRSLAEEEKSR